MPKQSSRQQEIGDLFKSSYNTTSTGASTSTENNRSTTQEANASSARQQEIAGLWGNRQVYTQPTTNTANHNTPTTQKTTQTAQPARQPGDIMAFGAGEYKTTKADEAVNAAIGYGVASFKKLLSDAARPTGELTMGESAQAAVKGISQQEAEKQKREKSKANEWSQRLNESAVDWYESAQKNEAKAREGLGDFGNLLVSAGIAGTQMAGDIALNALVPGSGIFAMAGRAYGSGSLEAQANGLTAGQQQLAGLKSAAIETISEKIFGYGSKIAYGSGLVKSPQVIESAINTLAKTNAGRTALKMLVGANEEGLEEVLSDLLNPIADRLLGLDSGTGNVYEDLQSQQVLEDYLVGGILGLLGGGTQVISGETMRANEEQRASEQAQRDIVSKGLESAEGTHSRILAEEYNKILAESSKRGHRYLYDSEVNSLQTALDMESRQGGIPNADAFNAAQQAKAQQDTAMRMMGARVFSSNDISSNIAKAVAGNAKSSASAQTTRSFNEVTSAISNSTQTTEQAQKLNATAKAVINGNEVSNSQLDALAENDSAMQAIAKYAGEELPTFKGTASEVRTAKRNWLKGISTATAQRIKQAQAQQAGKTAQRQTMPVVDYARKYGEDADKVVQAFSDGERIESNLFNAEFDAAYQLGKSGVDVDKAMAQKSIQDLSPSQRMVAYQMGVKAKSNTEQRKAKVKSKGNVSFDGETYTERGKTKTLPAVNPNGLTQEQKASIEVIKKIAEVTGINFVFYESEANEQGRYTESNGMFKDNTIYLDINAAKQFITDKSAILRTASHELTHYIQKHSPAQYAELKAFISQTLVENESLLGKGKTFDTLVANKAYTRGLSVEEATDEVIADACEMMLRDSKAVQTLAEENPTLFKTIRNWLREFCRKLRKAFEGVETAYTESTALLNELGRYTDELQRMWDNAFIDAVRSDFTEMENDAGDTVVLADNNGHAQLSVRTYDEGGREQLENYLAKRVKEGAITTAERDDMLSQMEAMYKICKDYAKQYTLFGQWSEAEVRTDPITGEPIFSVVKANGDYALNLDFSLVCKKRRTLDAVFNEMISQGIMDDFDMVERSIAAINDVIRENDFETACALCFVDTKRYRQAMVADSFVRIYNGLVRSMVKDGQKLSYFNFGEDKTIINPKDGIHTLADSELDFTKIEQFLHNPKYMPKAKKDGGMTTGSVEYRVAKLLKESPQDRKLLKRGDFMSTIGFDNVRQHNTRVLGLYNAKKGAGGPKATQSDVQYLSEILAQNKFNADSAYKVGGVRVQSFSDYIPRLCFDYVQMMGDLAAKQLPAHAYTKEPLFALQFGRTGMKINMSLVPEVIEGGVAPGLDKDGNYAWRDGQSFGSTVYGGSEEFVRKCYDIIGKEYNGQDRLTAQEGYELAMAIQNADGYHNNCGTIAVGVSNAHILKLIRDPNIRMVIPYHKSSLNHLVAVMTNVDKYVDYTKKQNTRLANGTKLESGDFNFNEALRRLGDAKAAADEYLAWCDEHNHNYIPKFEEFRNEENYYKLLEDFTCYDRDGNAAPQGAVQVNFPTADDAFGSMSDLIEMGLIEDTNLNAKQTAKVPEIVKQIKATLPELEQKWKDEANAKKKPKKSAPKSKVQKSERDVENGQKNNTTDGDVKYSLRQFEDGKKFVDVNTDQAQFDGLSIGDKQKLARKIIHSKFANKIIGIDNKVFANSRTAAEYAYPAKRIKSDDIRDAKYRASAELDNIVEAGDNFRTAPDGRDGHTHENAVGDYKYFDTIFKVGNDYYKGVINIRQSAKGSLLTDVTKIENITKDISSSYGQNPKSTFLRDVSMDSILHSSENINTKFSDRDSEYLSLAKDPEGNRDKLQAMVDEAAKKAGYDSPRLYHGTHSFGFTKFDLDMMDDKSTIFLTDNEYVAESYGGTLDKKDVSGRPFDPMTASDEEVLRKYNELNSHRQAAKIYTPNEVADLRAEYLSEIRKSSEAVQKLYQAMQNVEFRDALGLTDSDLQTVYALNTAAKSIATDGAADDLLYVDGLISSIIRTMSTNLSRSYGIMVPSEGFANSIRMLAVLNGITTNNEKVVITEKHGFAQTMKQVRRQLADNLIAEADQGIYSLYVNTDNLLEIECNGDLWDEIDVPKELREYVPAGANKLVNTRRIAAAAKEAGYDGVIFRDIVDVGADAYDYYESDVYAIYDPGRAKSADPVTYDDNGNVIPLSERFNAGNEDIRYSTRDSEGNELSPQQQEFFKDSKVRDEDGNLLVVYHGTDAEFTVFDRTKGRTNMDIQGMFFSPWELDAGGYGGNVGAYYINITNPASESMGYKALQKFKGQNGAGIKAREYLESLGYDGVNNGNEEYIAFNANQIKLTTNLNPTESEDIRYSERVTPADIAGFDKEAQEIIKNANRRVMYASHPTTMTANRFEKAFADMNGKGYFAFIDPWDFLYLTTNSVEDFLERNPNRLNEGVSEDWGTVNNIQNADSLFLRVEDDGNGNWKVIGHEGRHRMAALYRDGVDRVAVAIRMVGAEKTPQKIKRTYAQFGIGDIYIHDAIPATTEYKEVARKIFASEQGDIRYSERDSDRELLSTALESAARTKTEKALIAQYKENLSTLEDRQRTLQQARKELSDARKAKDTARAKSLENTVETLAKSVNAADEKLLKLQATEPLRNVVKRARTEERRAAKVKRDEAVKKTKAQAAAQKKKELDRVREQRDKRIEQVKKHNDEVNRNKRERSNVTAEWHSIAKLGKRFQQLIDHPTQKDSGHAPVGICQSALKLCKCFEIADRKRVIGNVKGAINELKARYASIKDDSALGIFHEQEMYNVIDAVSNEINALDSTEALNAETLHKIVKMLKMLDRTMVNANKFISHSIDKTIAQAGREWAKEINDATPMLKGKIGQFLNWQLRPDTFFKRLSGFAKNSMGEQIQAMFTEGTEKKLKVQQDFYLHFKDLTERKEYLELGKYKGEDLVDVGLVDADGNSILVTRDMMLAIYKHLSSNDNFMAVAYGGLEVPDLADYYTGKSKRAYDKSVLSDCMDAHMWEVQTEIMRIKAMISATEDEMQKQALKESLAELEIEADLLEREAFNKVQEIYINIQEKLTEYERELLNASTRWMDKSADYINEETMRMYGIEKAKVDNYWPIHRDTNFINTDLRTTVNDINLENWGSLKERVQSHAPVKLTGFAFELDNHTRRMSDFVGYAAVQRDFSKLYNTKLPAMRSSLARIVQQKFGSDNWLFGQSGQSYIDEYISAVSGSVQNGDALSNLYGNLAQATLSINLRVAVSQLASIPTAAAEVGWGNVARGLGEGFKIAFSKTAKEELAAKDPWYFQRYRGEGGMVEIASMKDASNFIGRQWNKLARSKVGSKLVNWCQDFDAFATSMMWAMAEEQVKENGGKPGDSNYDRLVSNVYRDIIRKTQPNYTVTERSGLLREKRGGLKFLTMYKTQSNQNLNILYEASATLRKYKQDFANSKNGVTEEDIKEAQKAVAQGYTAVLIGGTLAFSILRFLANAIMHSLDNYRDDEDDITLMSILGGITKETVSAMAGMVAFGGQVYDFVLPFIEDSRYYGLSDSAFAALSNILKGGQRLITKDDTDFEDFYKVFKDISNVLGLPTNNVRKLVNGARYHIEDLINGEFLSYEAGVERSQAVMAGKILDAVRAGDTDTADELFADAVESSSAQEPEKAVKAKVKSALKDAYNAGEIDDAEAQKILQDYFGYDKNAAYFEMRKFSEDVSSTYSPLYDALETGNRSDIRKEINDLLAHGKEEKDIKQSVTGHYREAYRNGSNEERVAIRKAMYASGLWDSSDEIIALCNKWLESK